MTEPLVPGPVHSRRAVFSLLARGAVVTVAVPAFLALENTAFAVEEPCVATELSADGLVRSAHYMLGAVPVTLTVAATGARTHRMEITSGTSSLLVFDADFTGLARNGRFG